MSNPVLSGIRRVVRAAVIPMLLSSELYAARAQEPPAGDPPKKQEKVLDVPSVHVSAPHEDAFGTGAIWTENVTERAFRLEQQVRVLPDAIKELPGVEMQRTGSGQSSPFVRGWTGFRTLYVLDGFRFNHSAWREGPNQYFSTIDTYLIDHIDVRYGSGSVRYGSDAVGGTVVMESARAGAPIAGDEFGGTFETRFASAEQSSTQHLDVGGSLPEGIAYRVGGTWANYGDLDGGRHVGEQEGTGYDVAAADTKLSWRIADHSEFVVAYQRSRTFDAPRTHATVDGISWHGTTIGTDLRRDFDQSRDFTYGRLDWREGGLFDRVRAGLGYHAQRENEVRVRGNGLRTAQGFNVGTLGGFLNFEGDTPAGRMLFGADSFHDVVNSFQRNYDANGVLTSYGIQGPVADDATYDASGAFLEDEIDLGSRLTLTVGGRAEFSRAAADKVRDPVTGNQIGLEQDWWSWAADVRARKDWSDDFGTWLACSRAIRVPNLSDLTRFDIALSGEIETPSPDLEPEKFTTVEFGVEGRSGELETRAATYVTFIDDMIVRFPTGNVVAGANEIQKANVGDGRMQGVDVGVLYHLDSAWSVGADASYVSGRVDTFLSPGVKEKEPLSKLPPIHGGVRLRWDDPASTFWVEGVCAWSDDQSRLSPLDELDTQRIPPDGTPGFFVAGIRAGVTPMARLDIVAAVENVTNRDYRLHGSGINEPGTNAVITVRYRF